MRSMCSISNVEETLSPFVYVLRTPYPLHRVRRGFRIERFQMSQLNGDLKSQVL